MRFVLQPLQEMTSALNVKISVLEDNLAVCINSQQSIWSNAKQMSARRRQCYLHICRLIIDNGRPVNEYGLSERAGKPDCRSKSG